MTCYAPPARARRRGVRLAGRSWLGMACVVAVAGLGPGCASRGVPVQVALPSHSPTPVVPADPAGAVVTGAEARLQAGLAEADEGHLEPARASSTRPWTST